MTLTNREDGDKLTAGTDEFGDFWFEGLKVGDWSLSIEKEGHRPCRMESPGTEKKANPGDIALETIRE